MNLIDFVKNDVGRTLLPLEAPAFIIQRGEVELRKYINDQIFSGTDVHHNFLQSPISYALKDRWHTRRVHLLDPISTLFIYDFVHKNSALFRPPGKTSVRRRYGYHLKAKSPLNASEEHQEFRQRILDCKRQYRYFCKLDIANCFAGVYHHDLVSALKRHVGEEPANRFGMFLRQINGGRSVSCFPQGYFPTKALGNLFLSFIEGSADLRSPVIIRFLDDVFMFSNSLKQIEDDFYSLQVMLSEKNLYLNARKTQIGDTRTSMRLPKTDDIRKNLLKKRAEALELAYDEEPESSHLTEREFEYLSHLISRADVAEEDVELALALVTEDQEHAERLARLVFEKYPHLIKSLYANLSSTAYEGKELWDLVGSVSRNKHAHEFLLFWCARIVLHLYEWDKQSAAMLLRFYEHPRSSDAVKAAILECEFIDYGLLERKESVLRNAGASILAVSAAAGLRKLESGRRNQMYKYAASSSPLMYQITRALQNK